MNTKEASLGGNDHDDGALGADDLERIAGLFDGVHLRSRVGLEQALQIRGTPGVGATLVIQIPSDTRKPVEVYFSTAPVTLVSDLSKR